VLDKKRGERGKEITLPRPLIEQHLIKVTTEQTHSSTSAARGRRKGGGCTTLTGREALSALEKKEAPEPRTGDAISRKRRE